MCTIYKRTDNEDITKKNTLLTSTLVLHLVFSGLVFNTSSVHINLNKLKCVHVCVRIGSRSACFVWKRVYVFRCKYNRSRDKSRDRIAPTARSESDLLRLRRDALISRADDRVCCCWVYYNYFIPNPGVGDGTTSTRGSHGIIINL